MTQLQTLQRENAQLRTATTGAAGTTTTQPRAKTKAPDRPVVDTNTGEREWELFKDSWNRYKTMTAITDQDIIRMELRAACSPDVNRLLFEYIGADDLSTAVEGDLLQYIKSVAVTDTHKEVHRMQFFRLSQMDGETITQYVARLRSHAVLCQFKIACSDHTRETFVNYSDDMVTQQLISGLKNPQHQSRILSEAAALPTLQQKIERLHCLESTELSTGMMRSATPPTAPSTANPVKSEYKRRLTNYQPPTHTPCKGCGRTTHEGKTMARKDCPAINKFCGNCGIKGHFRAVCQKKPSNQHTTSRSNSATEPLIEPESRDPDNTSFAFTTQDFRLAPNTTGHT